MAELGVGQTVEVKGSGRAPYVIKNCGEGGFSCTCPAWRNQSADPRVRTCKHIRDVRGDEAERARVASAGPLPSRVPEGGTAAAPVLLAESWDGQSSVAGWWMSEKLDGVRAYWDGRRFTSRNGNLFLAPDWFTADLPPVPLDGELWAARKRFTQAQGVAMSQTRAEEWRQLRFVVYDAPAHGGEFESRLRFLTDLVATAPPQFVHVLEQQPCRDAGHLRAELGRVEALGGEGLMLRQPGSLYVAGRSGTLLKVKTFQSAEAVVVGYQPGEGRHKGRVGALLARLPDGKEFRVGTGLSDAERSSPPPVGSLITFKYQELTDTGVPRFPSYVGLRPDVTEPARLPSAPAVDLAPPAVAVRVTVSPPPAPPVVRRLEYASGGVARFWEATLSGRELSLHFGVVSTEGRTKSLTYPGEASARAALAELLAEKLDDGFTEPAAAPAPPAAPTPLPAGARRFEFVGGTSSKFWEVWIEGGRMATKYGRIGSAGTTTVKDFADEAAARKAADKKTAEKLREGYVERRGG